MSYSYQSQGVDRDNISDDKDLVNVKQLNSKRRQANVEFTRELGKQGRKLEIKRDELKTLEKSPPNSNLYTERNNYKKDHNKWFKQIESINKEIEKLKEEHTKFVTERNEEQLKEILELNSGLRRVK